MGWLNLKRKMLCFNLLKGKFYGEIYVLIFSNGKKYVGKTMLDSASRFRFHLHTPPQRRSLVSLAIHKYGKPLLTVLERGCYYSHELALLETKWILCLNTIDRKFGYNLVAGGNSTPTFISDETRAKMSLSQRGRKHSEETKQKISQGNKGKKLSEETLSKINRSGYKHTEATKQKMSKSQTGRKHPESVRKKMMRSQLGHVCSNETRAKISLANKGRKCSPERIEEMRRIALEIQAKKRETKKKSLCL